jgi:cobalt/nickel transport system ATP-binding protein
MDEAPVTPLHAAPAPPSGPALQIRGLRFAYPDGTSVLHGIDLVVPRGQSLAIIGPNGAGKSTLLLQLNGILKGSGEISVLGLPVEPKNLRDIRRRVGVVFQDPEDQLFLGTVAQDVAFGPSNMGLSKEEIAVRVREALEAVGMEDGGERSSHHLSFGQKKRVAVATVLSMRPDILVLDEPTSNLDPKSRRRLLGILQELQVTKLVVTHDLPVAYELCERTVILDQGRIVADGPTEEVLADERLLAAHDLELPYLFGAPAASARRRRRGV